MTVKSKKGLEFDPGFNPLVLAFRGTVDYLYLDINRFKNLSQKKVKFMQYYKKILDLLYNNVGFYVGCLMWAAYLKAQDEQDILSNTCYGDSYSEDEITSDTQYILKFIELFPKDMKYFLGQNFEFDKNITKLVSVYEEFLTENKGFSETKTNSDIKLPKSVKTKDVDLYKSLVDNAIKSKDLALLKDEIEKVI